MASKLKFDQEPRGSKGRLERLATLDVESRDDFLTGYRTWGSSRAIPAAVKRFDKLLEQAGIDPKSTDTPMEDIFAGHIYHYSTNNFYNAGKLFNYQAELHTRLGNQVPEPEDGKVARVLDIGCGMGNWPLP